MDLVFHITVLCVGCHVVLCMHRDLTEESTHTLGSISERVKCTNHQEEIELHNLHDRITLCFMFNSQGCNFQVHVSHNGMGPF